MEIPDHYWNQCFRPFLPFNVPYFWSQWSWKPLPLASVFSRVLYWQISESRLWMATHRRLFCLVMFARAARHTASWPFLKVSLPSCLLLAPLSVSDPAPACCRVWGRLCKSRSPSTSRHPSSLTQLRSLTASCSRRSALSNPSSSILTSIPLPHVPVDMDYRTLSHSPTAKTRLSISHFRCLRNTKQTDGCFRRCQMKFSFSEMQNV